jgi:hypothetical protein
MLFRSIDVGADLLRKTFGVEYKYFTYSLSITFERVG